MFGNNPISPVIVADGQELAVTEIFSTFQGEGPFVGYPAVFLRLAGCNLACKFCDTEFDYTKQIALPDIINEIVRLSKNSCGEIIRKLVVITGGEPMRQPIEALCLELISQSYQVQIETNGTIYRDLAEEVSIICSPKNTGKGYFPIREDLLARINALKFIISASNELYQNIGEVGQSMFNIPVYLQPMDEYNDQKNKDNLSRTIKIAVENGYRYCLQTHKIIGIE